MSIHSNNINPSSAIRSADRKATVLVSLPKWIAWAIIAWQARLSIEALTGKYAFPSLLTRFWRQASIWEVVCWSAGLLGVMAALHSRYLLHKQVHKEWAQMQIIEKRLEALAAGSEQSPAAKGRKEI